jgi:ethanolamine utilization protein EutA
MTEAVALVGLDFGTTTSSAVVAEASLVKSAVTGRSELADFRERFRSEMAFTPLTADDRIDEPAVEALLDTWLAGVRPDELFGGGALLTGLTAQRANAASLVRLVRARLGDALIATADDPCLESWLAFMGSCAALSRARPDVAFLNLDIGGGTTNLALGRAGEVLATGCLFVGARHVQVEPGSYRIVKLSRYARSLFERLAIAKGPGEELVPREVEAVLSFCVALLEAAVRGSVPEHSREFVQVPFRRPAEFEDVVLTFSGGVGELIYAHLDGAPWPATTQYGDLGIDLARRIVQSPLWHRRSWSIRPASAGRATVYGLLRHTTEVSGSTLFLPRPDALPLRDVPVLGSVRGDAGRLGDLVALARRCGGAAIVVEVGGHGAEAVRALGTRLAELLEESAFPGGQTLVLLVRENVGKALGQYATRWGALPASLVVIDEVTPRDAQYVQVGAPRGGVVPVSFYGLHPSA